MGSGSSGGVGETAVHLFQSGPLPTGWVHPDGRDCISIEGVITVAAD